MQKFIRTLTLLFILMLLACPDPEDLLPGSSNGSSTDQKDYGEGTSTLKIYFTPLENSSKNPLTPDNVSVEKADFTFELKWEGETTGMELLRKADLENLDLTVEFELAGEFGAIIKTITYKNKSFAGFGSDGYWAYWTTREKDPTLTFSQKGAGSRILFDGSVDYWIPCITQ